MQPQQLRLTEDDRVNLVAYLDGELVDEDAQAMEAKIAKSVSAQKEVQALEKTWGMLEWLPRPELAPDFATQTVSRIHSQQLASERFEGRIKFGAAIAAKSFGWVASLAAAAAISFIGVRFAWPDPTRRLIEDLDIVENLESYRMISDIKFLDDLSRQGQFVDPPPAAAESPPTDSPDGAAKAPPDENGRN